ncbi:MAG: histidine kinase dimerization/phospho-acceptor domain-containing protein [Anaerovoracaceae bacterium]
MQKKHSVSLAAELGLISLLALLAAIICYFVVGILSNALLNQFFDINAWKDHREEQILEDFREYTEQNELAASNWYELNRWTMKRSHLSLAIYRNDALIYDSGAYSAQSNTLSPEITINEAPKLASRTETYMERKNAAQVQFSDGPADVVLHWNGTDRFRRTALVLQILLSCAVAMGIILVSVRKKMKYLTCLCDQIRIMEGGDLDQPITIRGNDEITRLASGLEEMRKSLIQKIAHIMQLQEDSKLLVTEMSHDLRTPMTPLLVYLGMLREKRYQTEEEHDEYVEKTYLKASELKHLSDQMFSYFLMDKNAEVPLETLTMNEVFYDQLSNMAAFLTAEGCTSQIDLKMEDASIMVNPDYTIRIFDNLVSNITKYADPAAPIIISLFTENEKVILHISNRINELADYSGSHGFGVKNIKKMMTQMNAETIIHQNDDRYETFLLFRIVSRAEPESDLQHQE